MKHAIGWAAVSAIGLFVLGGCAGNSPRVGGAETLRDPRGLLVVGRDGGSADFDAVASECAGADAVLIGEIHGHPQGLEFAAALWEAVLARAEGAALSMEFFERDQQAALDDYLAGVTDGPAFEKASGRTPGGYPPGHRRMVEAAKAAVRPVIAANAPRRYTRLARMEGYERLESLTPEQRRLFEVPVEMPTGKYREEFMSLMGGMDAGHQPGGAESPPDPGAQQKMLDGFFRSQSLWDATMAASIDRALGEGHRPVVHLVGRFHVQHDGGTVQLLRARRPGAKVVTVVVVDAWDQRAEDAGKADFVVYAGPGPEPEE